MRSTSVHARVAYKYVNDNLLLIINGILKLSEYFSGGQNMSQCHATNSSRGYLVRSQTQPKRPWRHSSRKTEFSVQHVNFAMLFLVAAVCTSNVFSADSTFVRDATGHTNMEMCVTLGCLTLGICILT